MKRPLATAVILLLLVPGCYVLETLGLYTPPPTVSDQVRQLRSDVAQRQFGFEMFPTARIDSVSFDSSNRRVFVDFNTDLSFTPFREPNAQELRTRVSQYFSGTLDSFDVVVRSMKIPVEDLIPNYYRSGSTLPDSSRLVRGNAPRPEPLVRNVSRPLMPTRGLQGRYIGLWHSHGWYYNNELDRWEWQRPRLFMTVEDLIPMSFTIPYLIPMLENAGATVFVPRERDLQTNEVVVDNDSLRSGYREIVPKGSSWQPAEGPGFAVGHPPYGPGVNPFQLGTARMIRADVNAAAEYVPAIPQAGSYAVYVSYASTDSSTTRARYRVRHLGGSTEFLVNQKIGGGTWIYLGTFRFRAGAHSESGSVLLSSPGDEPGTWITADAVRFGGGMGVVARGGQASGRPKFVEGSRCWLQYAGMPDTLVYSLSRGRHDYRDDYMSRAEYLNFLRGAPFGPNPARDVKGLGIPIDLSLAFHTDAGITNNDTTVGTLSIYTLEGMDSLSVFPDSMSRLANRDFADILQTQIVDDLRATFDPAWTRRQLRSADYSESRRPNMPSALLELLSHQNFLDMKFMLDPRFRFQVSRAIYKAMLRFLATQYSTPYVVQPLAITHFCAIPDSLGNAQLRWRPRTDPLEPSAIPTHYIVYTRKDDGGFDNGIVARDTFLTVHNLVPGVRYGFSVAAVNDGGESFASEILPVCIVADGKGPALIVNAFDRISGPATVETPDYKGFLADFDAGVADRMNPGFTGTQHSFVRTNPYRSNDAPGHGASFADHEGEIVAGNTFDFAAVHAEALAANGWSVGGASDEAVMDSVVTLGQFRFVDVAFGEEKTTRWQRSALDSTAGPAFQAFPPPMQKALQEYGSVGGALLVSGSYIGSELFADPRRDTLSVQFAQRTLRFGLVTDHAARSGRVIAVDSAFLPRGTEIRYNTEVRPDLYAAEAVDAIAPADSARQILRYAENLFGAGTAYRGPYGVIALAFPFETIVDTHQRTMLMRAILNYLRP